MNWSVARPRWRSARSLHVNERTLRRSYPSVPNTCEHHVVTGSGDHHDRRFAILLFVSLPCCLCTTGSKRRSSAPAPDVPTRPPCKGLRRPRRRNGNARRALTGRSNSSEPGRTRNRHRGGAAPTSRISITVPTLPATELAVTPGAAVRQAAMRCVRRS